eukprot:RCo018085
MSSAPGSGWAHGVQTSGSGPRVEVELLSCKELLDRTPGLGPFFNALRAEGELGLERRAGVQPVITPWTGSENQLTWGLGPTRSLFRGSPPSPTMDMVSPMEWVGCSPVGLR